MESKKESIFHFFGNIMEQSPLPTTIKLAIFFKLDLLLFFLNQFTHRFIRNRTEYRISKDFMKYIYKRDTDSYKKKVIMLKRGLDEQSKILIDSFLERQEHIHTHNVLDDRLFTKEELIEQRINIYPVKRKYRGLSSYYGIENFHYHCGLFFLPKKMLDMYKGRDVIDAGASNGDTPVIFSREYSFGTIYAFEPENNNYAQLIKNIKRFHLRNVIPINVGVGDKNTKMKITSESGQSHISPYGTQKIVLTTIDELVEKNKMALGLIKMDIEGFEYLALQGSLKTIKKFHPILLISIYHTGRDFFEIKPLLEKLGGYTFMVRKLNPYHYFFDTMLICLPTK